MVWLQSPPRSSTAFGVNFTEFFSDIISLFIELILFSFKMPSRRCHLYAHQRDKWLINTRIRVSSGQINVRCKVQLGHTFVLLEARAQLFRHVCVDRAHSLLSISSRCLSKQGVKLQLELGTPLGGEAEGKSKPLIPFRAATSALSNDAGGFWSVQSQCGFNPLCIHCS